jgi:hypothetical protein
MSNSDAYSSLSPRARERGKASDAHTLLVTAGLDPAVHAEVRSTSANPKLCFYLFAAWIAGSSPAMTKEMP